MQKCKKCTGGIGAINQGLEGFEPKEVFGWYCDICISVDKKTLNGLPTDEELEILRNFESILRNLVAGPDSEHPNALYLGHLIGGGEMVSMWMVYDPKVANNNLQSYIDSGRYLRHFEYSITSDEEWKTALHFLGKK